MVDFKCLTSSFLRLEYRHSLLTFVPPKSLRLLEFHNLYKQLRHKKGSTIKLSLQGIDLRDEAVDLNVEITLHFTSFLL